VVYTSVYHSRLWYNILFNLIPLSQCTEPALVLGRLLSCYATVQLRNRKRVCSSLCLSHAGIESKLTNCSVQNWHIVSPRYIFSSRGRTPWVILTVKWDAVSGTDPRLRAKFQPNPFRSLRADASQTDRHTSYPQLLRQIWSFTTQGTNNHEIMRSSVTGSAQTLVFFRPTFIP